MISVQINQALLRGGQCYPKKRLNEVLKTIEQVIGQRSYDLSIAFVQERVIQKANRVYRGKNRVTDVLSFGLTPESGELLICYSQARKQALDMRHSVRDEVTFLIVHGVLHLFGHDHERSSEKKKMFALQEQILKKLDVDARLTL